MKGKGWKGKGGEGEERGREREERGREGGEGERRLTLMRSWNRAAYWLKAGLGTVNCSALSSC